MRKIDLNNDLESLKILRSVFFKHDPAGLLVEGIPEDEYDTEIINVMNASGNNKNIIDFAKNIQYIFQKRFNDKIAGSFDIYIKIAKDINESLDLKLN